ncbi:MAG TPA: hypothetical protein VKR58_06310 [Aquella sp.]|nr:hypothetical protein [Aquella sp.]
MKQKIVDLFRIRLDKDALFIWYVGNIRFGAFPTIKENDGFYFRIEIYQGNLPIFTHFNTCDFDTEKECIKDLETIIKDFGVGDTLEDLLYV